jgi:hypothetical protein
VRRFVRKTETYPSRGCSRATKWRARFCCDRGCSLTRGAGSLDPRLMSVAPPGHLAGLETDSRRR